MSITNVLSLLGGLSLFLYGMQMMSSGLENIAGNKMKSILEKLTANRFLGVIVGAVITAVIQSSSATTVMVVGFVNTGMMTLSQAVWIIMGANIGTTITGQLISLDIGALAPLFAFFGVAAIVFLKSPKINYIGQILAGFGVLFIGMDMMGASMAPLKESQEFISLMTRFSNPVLGILAGAVFTAVIQSSSASVGILQTLAAGGLIPFSSAVFVLFGQNIGTCITAVLASIGTNKNAKRTTLLHLLFNIIGTTVFTIVCLILPLTNFVESITPANPTAQIANMHTIFNIVTTLLLLPLGNYLAKLAVIILPERAGDKTDEDFHFSLSNVYAKGKTKLGYSAIHMDMLAKEIERMIVLAKENVSRCFDAVLNTDFASFERAQKVEETIDYLNKEISQYISKTLVYNNTGTDIAATEEFFKITGNTERIGDHALNIGGYVQVMEDKKVVFSNQAKDEIRKMQSVCQNALEMVLHKSADTTAWLKKIADMEQEIDDMTETYRESHIERMKRGECSEEACILYSEMLTDFERIGDHVLNIGQAYSKMNINV